jgi:hypothetical protein
MPIQVDWSQTHDDTLTITFEGDWTWQDFYGMGERTRDLIVTRTAPVHVLYDLRPSTARVKSPVMHLRHFAAHLPENARMGLHVYVGATTFWKACITAFCRVYPTLAPDIVYVSDEADAFVAIVRKQEQLALLLDDSVEV